jgi:predicted MFS family arabinose efflux permease
MTLRKLPAALVVYGAALAHGLAVVSYPASAAVLKARALSDAAYGAIFLPQMIGTLLGSLLGARATGSRARTLALSLMAAALAEAFLYATPNAGAATAWLGTTALGIGFGLAAAPLNGLPGDLFPRQAESALVLLHSLLACGFALGPVLVARAIEARAWGVVPFGVAVLALVLAIAALLVLPRAAPGAALSAAIDDSRSTSSAHQWFMIIVVLYALAEGTFANWAVVYLREERAIDPAPAALALAMFWFALTLGRLAVSALVRVIPAQPIWCALPLAMLAVFLALPHVMTAPQGIAAFALAGFACSAFFPLSVSLAGRSIRGGAARASSLLTAALMIGVGIGSFVIGPLRASSSIAGLYRVSALYPLLAFVLCAYVVRRPRNAGRGAGVLIAED